MTMVSPIHLLLFGSRKVEYIDNVVKLDNWINLDMDPIHAAAIVALRPALESLVVKAAKEPETILELSSNEQKVLFYNFFFFVLSFSSNKLLSFFFFFLGTKRDQIIMWNECLSL